MQTIRIDDHGVLRELDGGKVEEVSWDDLQEVGVLTTGDGPFGEDFLFVLVGRNGTGCVIPQGAPESPALLERLQRLPGFDNEALIQATCSTDEAKFVCWRRDWTSAAGG
jgi:hypothetical protein